MYLCQPHSWSAYQRKRVFDFHCLIGPKWTTHKDDFIVREHRFDIISVSDFGNDNFDKGCLLSLETAQSRFGGPINGEWRNGRFSGPKSDCLDWQLQRREGQTMQDIEGIEEAIAVYLKPLTPFSSRSELSFHRNQDVLSSRFHPHRLKEYSSICMKQDL